VRKAESRLLATHFPGAQGPQVFFLREKHSRASTKVLTVISGQLVYESTLARVRLITELFNIGDT
jgi:hypothetical protein